MAALRDSSALFWRTVKVPSCQYTLFDNSFYFVAAMMSQVKSRRRLAAYGSILCKHCAAVKKGDEMLDRASEAGHYTCLAAVLKTGAAVTSRDWTDIALMSAAKRGQNKCVEVLIAAGADVNHKDTSGWSVLMMAAQNGHSKCVEVFITAGVDVNYAKEKNTALIEAALNGQEKCVGLLMRAGAVVNKTLSVGAVVNGETDMNTALIKVAVNGQEKCVDVLTQAGAKH